MKKRYTIYMHKSLCASVEVAANSLEEAKNAVENGLNSHVIDAKFDELDEVGVDQVQADEGSDHPEWAEYEVNEDGELVEVEG